MTAPDTYDRPFLLRSGEGDSVWSTNGLFTTKLGGSHARGNLAVLESVLVAGLEPGMHIHHREDEAFYVLDGHLTFQCAGEVLEATTGSFVFAPRGLPHTFLVDGDKARVLVFAAPAGFEHFVRDLGVPADGDAPPDSWIRPTREVIGRVAERHGIELVGPPLRALDGGRS
jgi:quercetin dioxygenase-like cupin family protein